MSAQAKVLQLLLLRDWCKPYSFWALKDNVWKEIVGWTFNSAIEGGRPNHIKVIAEGSNFEFYVNDVLIDGMFDASFSSGKCGLGIELYHAGDIATFEFDNFRLSGQRNMEEHP